MVEAKSPSPLKGERESGEKDRTLKMKCSTCFEMFDNIDHTPMCLPCGHTLCDECIANIKKLNKGNTLSCPTCRTKFPMTTKFPKNYTILELLEVAEEPKVVPPKTRYCKSHPNKKQKFFCLTCNIGICIICFQNEHLGHVLERPLKNKHDLIADYNKLKDNLEEMQFHTVQMKSQANVTSRILFNRKEEELGAIEVEFEKVVNILNQRKIFAQEQVSQLFNKKYNEVEADRDIVITQESIINELIVKLNTFYNKNLKESDVGEERKAEIALTDLNKLVEEFMPIIEKGKNSVNESWYSFKIPQFPYPTFSVDSNEAMKWIKDIGTFHNIKVTKKCNLQEEPTMMEFLKRVPLVLFFTQKDSSDVLLQYDLKSHIWLKPVLMKREKQKSGGHFYKSMRATTLPGGDVLLSGGVDPMTQAVTNKVKLFKRSTLGINMRAPMQFGRMSHAAIELNGWFYAFGGNDKSNKLTQCERFDYDADKWESIASISCGRFGSACACALGDDKIYLFGGEHTNSIELYYIRENRWEQVPLSYERSACWMLNVSACFLLDPEHILIMGNFLLNVFLPKTNMLESKTDSVKHSIDKCVYYKGNIFSFAREHPYFTLQLFTHDYTFSNKLAYINMVLDLDLRVYPAALTDQGIYWESIESKLKHRQKLIIEGPSNIKNTQRIGSDPRLEAKLRIQLLLQKINREDTSGIYSESWEALNFSNHAPSGRRLNLIRLLDGLLRGDGELTEQRKTSILNIRDKIYKMQE